MTRHYTDTNVYSSAGVLIGKIREVYDIYDHAIPDYEYRGSLFVQVKQVPRGVCVNYGCNANYLD